jgi:hypothetical protein
MAVAERRTMADYRTDQLVDHECVYPSFSIPMNIPFTQVSPQ